MLMLLDRGVSLYRRHFLSFVLIAAAWFVPVAIAVGLGIALGSRSDTGLLTLFLLLGALLGFVMLVYLVAVLSRAAWATIEGRTIRAADILAIGPLRLLTMSIFTIVYFVLAQLVSSIASLICICPAYIMGIVLVGGAFALGETAGAAGGIVLGLLFGVIYALALFISGAVYSGLIYGLQPWAQERVGFGVSLQRSIDLMIYRFWGNIAAWGMAALLLAAAGVVVASTLTLAIWLPLGATLGQDNPVTLALTASTALIALVFVLPPLPIWMALLYQRNYAAREGDTLQTRISAWQQH